MAYPTVPSSKMSCAFARGFYLCSPKDSSTRGVFVALQKAIDGFLNVLPLFKPIKPEPGQNPIGTSKAGYDGVVGPTTSGLGLTALIGAMQVRKEAGATDIASPVLATVVADAREIPRTVNFSTHAQEITNYLVSATQAFPDLLKMIQERRAEGERSVFVEPPKPTVIQLPADIARNFKSPATRYAGFGLIAAVAAGFSYILWRGSQAEANAAERAVRNMEF